MAVRPGLCTRNTSSCWSASIGAAFVPSSAYDGRTKSRTYRPRKLGQSGDLKHRSHDLKSPASMDRARHSNGGLYNYNAYTESQWRTIYNAYTESPSSSPMGNSVLPKETEEGFKNASRLLEGQHRTRWYSPKHLEMCAHDRIGWRALTKHAHV